MVGRLLAGLVCMAGDIAGARKDAREEDSIRIAMDTERCHEFPFLFTQAGKWECRSTSKLSRSCSLKEEKILGMTYVYIESDHPF